MGSDARRGPSRFLEHGGRERALRNRRSVAPCERDSGQLLSASFPETGGWSRAAKLVCCSELRAKKVGLDHLTPANALGILGGSRGKRD